MSEDKSCSQLHAAQANEVPCVIARLGFGMRPSVGHADGQKVRCDRGRDLGRHYAWHLSATVMLSMSVSMSARKRILQREL